MRVIYRADIYAGCSRPKKKKKEKKVVWWKAGAILGDLRASQWVPECSKVFKQAPPPPPCHALPTPLHASASPDWASPFIQHDYSYNIHIGSYNASVVSYTDFLLHCLLIWYCIWHFIALLECVLLFLLLFFDNTSLNKPVEELNRLFVYPALYLCGSTPFGWVGSGVSE